MLVILGALLPLKHSEEESIILIDNLNQFPSLTCTAPETGFSSTQVILFTTKRLKPFLPTHSDLTVLVGRNNRKVRIIKEKSKLTGSYSINKNGLRIGSEYILATSIIDFISDFLLCFVCTIEFPY